MRIGTSAMSYSRYGAAGKMLKRTTYINTRDIAHSSAISTSHFTFAFLIKTFFPGALPRTK